MKLEGISGTSALAKGGASGSSNPPAPSKGGGGHKSTPPGGGGGGGNPPTPPGGGGGGNGDGPDSAWRKEVAKRRKQWLAMSPSQQGLNLFSSGFMSQADALRAMKDGTISEYVNQYWDLMEKNGDPAPTKRTVKDHRDGYGSSVSDKIKWIRDDTGVSEAEADAYLKEFKRWTGADWGHADAKLLDSYVEKAPTYEGEGIKPDGVIHRGMHLTTEEYDKFMEKVKAEGTVSMHTCSSWSSDVETARRFGHVNDDCDSVILHCVQNKTGTSIVHLSKSPNEMEVLAHSKTEWTVLRVEDEPCTSYPGRRKTHIYVIEKGAYKQ